MLFLIDTNYDPATSNLTSSYTAIRGNEREAKKAIYRVYTYRELMAMFDNAGLDLLRSDGEIDRQPFAIGAGGLWVVARR